ncbi:polyribonucleotide nucleotidyltransferase [Patescibacteria group bacterium]
MKTKQQFKTQINGKELVIETGKMAGLADGAATVKVGDTVILASACIADEPKESSDFFPLLVDYEERLYAAGKISGSRFIKREGRPSDKAILTARLIDRPIRPLFPKGYRNDVQIVLTALSVDLEHDVDIAALIGASVVLIMAGAPFQGPVGASRVGMDRDGKFILNPSSKQTLESPLNLVVAGTEEKVMMIEAKASELPEKKMLEAIEFAHRSYQPIIKLQKDLAKKVAAVQKQEEKENEVVSEVKKYLGGKLAKAVRELDQIKKRERLAEFQAEVLENFEGNYKQIDLKSALDSLIAVEIRNAILKDELRPDGRKLDEIRPIDIEIGLLPRTHGSALFSRGDTQALTIATLGSPGEEQIIETMEVEGTKRYMHHYNFPPYSTGEIKPMRGASRREIGHGSLAEKALEPVLPNKEDFPYTIRLVSEILSSNGSSSMAATCGSTMALMDAGVPIKNPVAGVAMGLITDQEHNKYKILTDLQGLEDYYGDMDFKITGTKIGITAIQLDIKINGLAMNIIRDAMARSKKARDVILTKMADVLDKPRAELSPHAPRIEKIKISPEKIGELIGPGGKVINKIIEDSGGKEVISIDIEEDGTVLVSSTDPEMSKKAVSMVKSVTMEPVIGQIYQGQVMQIVKDRFGKEIGMIVKFAPNLDGMVHISQIAKERINTISERYKVGDKTEVKIVAIDKEKNRISLSTK